MAFCKNCGSQMSDDATFCTVCGTPAGNAAQPSAQQNTASATVTQPPQPVDDATDVAQSKALAWLAYIPWAPAFLAPFFARKWSKYARFHVRQGATLWACSVAYGFVQGIISGIVSAIVRAIYYNTFAGTGIFAITILTNVVLSAVDIFICVLAIIGIVKAATGQKYQIPLISKIPFIAKAVNFFYGKMGVDTSNDD